MYTLSLQFSTREGHGRVEPSPIPLQIKSDQWLLTKMRSRDERNSMMFHCSTSEKKQNVCVWLHFQAFFPLLKCTQTSLLQCKVNAKRIHFHCLAAAAYVENTLLIVLLLLLEEEPHIKSMHIIIIIIIKARV